MKRLFLFLVFLGFAGATLCAQTNNARMLSGVNKQTGTSYTFVAVDATRLTTFNNPAPVAVSLPNGATFGFGPGTEFSVQNLGAGTVTITCASCTINGSPTLALVQNAGTDLYGDGQNFTAVITASVGSAGQVNVGVAGEAAYYPLSTAAVSPQALLSFSGLNSNFGGPVNSASDGTHAGLVSVTGNTTVPALPSNSFGLIAPNSASFTSYAFQFPSTPPSNGQTFLFGTPSGGVVPVTYAAGGGTTTGTGTANTVTKWTGASAIGNSSVTDDGSAPTRSPNGSNVATSGGSAEYLNDTVTGTVVNKLACDNGSGKAILCSHLTSTTNIPLGVVISGAGLSGSSVICSIFFCSVISDNQTTAKHWLISSSTIDGDVHDTGATTETAGQPNLYNYSANAGVGTATVIRLYTPDSQAATTACPTCITIASPAAGLLHLSGAVRTATSSAVVGADMTNNTVTATQLAAQYSKGSCTEVWGGSGAANAMASGDDAIVNNSCYNDSAVTRTITAVKCRSDNAANTTVLTPTFGSAGTGTAILTGTVTCGNSYAYSATGTLTNTAWTTGTGIDPGMSTVGNATSIALIVEYTY